jgi:hypothetical protein
MCMALHSLGKASHNVPASVFDTWPSIVYRWLAGARSKLPRPEAPSGIVEMEFDEMRHFIGPKNRLWVIKALDRGLGARPS